MLSILDRYRILRSHGCNNDVIYREAHTLLGHGKLGKRLRKHIIEVGINLRPDTEQPSPNLPRLGHWLAMAMRYFPELAGDAYPVGVGITVPEVKRQLQHNRDYAEILLFGSNRRIFEVLKKAASRDLKNLSGYFPESEGNNLKDIGKYEAENLTTRQIQNWTQTLLEEWDVEVASTIQKGFTGRLAKFLCMGNQLFLRTSHPSYLQTFKEYVEAFEEASMWHAYAVALGYQNELTQLLQVADSMARQMFSTGILALVLLGIIAINASILKVEWLSILTLTGLFVVVLFGLSQFGRFLRVMSDPQRVMDARLRTLESLKAQFLDSDGMEAKAGELRDEDQT